MSNRTYKLNAAGGVLGLDGSGVAVARLVPRSGTASSLASFVGVDGELIHVSDSNELKVSDGETATEAIEAVGAAWKSILHTVANGFLTPVLARKTSIRTNLSGGSSSLITIPLATRIGDELVIFATRTGTGTHSITFAVGVVANVDGTLTIAPATDDGCNMILDVSTAVARFIAMPLNTTQATLIWVCTFNDGFTFSPP